jgi:hypothetical protein
MEELFSKEGNYSRFMQVHKIVDHLCTKCGVLSNTLRFDTSGGEYGELYLCKECLIKLSEKYPDIKFLKVDSDQAEELCKHYEVSALPTILFINNGDVLSIIKGFNLDKMNSELDELNKIEVSFNEHCEILRVFHT